MDEFDKMRFIALLYLCNSTREVDLLRFDWSKAFSIERDETLVDIGTYCLMDNHFHIIIRQRLEKGISKFMQKLSTAYTMYFNTKYERSGALFQGRFKARHVADDRYMQQLFAYVHLNPLGLIDKDWKKGVSSKSEAAAIKHLMGYKESSLPDYLSDTKPRPEEAILNREVFPNHHLDSGDFLDFLFAHYQKDPE